MSSQPIVAHLVHGTWPRGIRLPSFLRPLRPDRVTWYDEGSDFRADLARLVGGQLSFEVFEWSGSNSILARKEATEALEQHLADAIWRRQDAHHFVIAHSHGGNVALAAVGNEPVSGLITLATPFLDVRPCNATRAEVWLLDRAMIGAIRLPLLLGILALFWYRTPLFHPELARFLLYALGFAWLMTTILPKAFMDRVRRNLGLTQFVSERFPGEDLSIGKPLRFELLPRDPAPPGLPACPLLVVRAEDDEAARVLAMARTAATAWATLWRLVPPLAQLVASAVSLIFHVPESIRQIIGLAWYLSALSVLFLITEVMEFNPWLLLPLVSLVFFETTLGLLTAPLLFGTVGFYALGFGWEMLYVAHLLDIQATSKPIVPACQYITVRDLQRGHGYLRHSLHEFPQVRRLVVSWMLGNS
jgi:hypothetical protein